MDPVGFTVSILALAGLFSTCVECWQYIDSARSHGRDYELLTTKLDVEKTRLLIWGDMIGIFRTTADGRNKVLDSPEVARVIERILNCIITVFTDSQALVSRYGLVRTKLEANDDLPPAQSLSTNQLAKLKASYKEFKSRIKYVQDNTSVLEKTRWAIQDQSKFIKFVADLRQLIDGLKDIIQSAADRAQEREAIAAEIDSLPNLQTVKLVRDASAEVHDEWSDVASQVLEMSILESNDKPNIMSWIKDVDRPESEQATPKAALRSTKVNLDTKEFDPQRYEKLHWAAITGNKDGVRSLLDQGANVDARDTERRTALYRAASSGFNEGVMNVAQLLIDRGANLEARSADGSTPLLAATLHRDLRIVQLLLENGAFLETRDNGGVTSLGKAAQVGDCSIIQELLDRGANIEATTSSGGTPLNEACFGRHGQAAALLLERGANIECLVWDGATPLVEAARFGNDPIVSLLLMKGANVEATDDGRTPLNWAVREGNTAIVEGLLTNGASAKTGFLEAAWWPGRTREIQILSEYRRSESEERDRDGRTALIRTACRGHKENMETLLKYGAVLDAVDHNGGTAIMRATDSGHISIVRYLADHGANIRLADSYGRTILHSAAKAGDPEITGYFIELGLELNQRSYVGETALLDAARNGYPRVVDLLLSQGASKLIANNAGETPLDLARRNGNEETVGLLS
ncbi:MAG: hypothetical protein M1827_004938 [Pycnora praestabilis]|nr:MAG: hypothetical protein M1827_004938 [Pycnora praestabilis]